MKANALRSPVLPAAVTTVTAAAMGLALATAPARAQMGDPSKDLLRGANNPWMFHQAND